MYIPCAIQSDDGLCIDIIDSAVTCKEQISRIYLPTTSTPDVTSSIMFLCWGVYIKTFVKKNLLTLNTTCICSNLSCHWISAYLSLVYQLYKIDSLSLIYLWHWKLNKNYIRNTKTIWKYPENITILFQLQYVNSSPKLLKAAFIIRLRQIKLYIDIGTPIPLTSIFCEIMTYDRDISNESPGMNHFKIQTVRCFSSLFSHGDMRNGV